MKKAEWFFSYFPLFVILSLDLASKNWAVHLSGIKKYKWVIFELNQNHGAFLSLFADLPNLLRIVSLSTIGVFIVCTYAILQYILPIHTLKFRIGLAFLAGGIVSNVYDRVFHSYVVDFIIFGPPKLQTAPFNLADAVQWLGYILVSIAILKDGDLIWLRTNKRKKIWINHIYQLKFILFLVLVGMTLTLLGAGFSYTYLKVALSEVSNENVQIVRKYIKPFIITYFVISIAFIFILILVGRILSHRSAGPIFAFERFIDSLVKGDNKELKLRDNDDFKNLEKIAKKLKFFFKQSNSTQNANQPKPQRGQIKPTENGKENKIASDFEKTVYKPSAADKKDIYIINNENADNVRTLIISPKQLEQDSQTVKQPSQDSIATVIKPMPKKT